MVANISAISHRLWPQKKDITSPTKLDSTYLNQIAPDLQNRAKKTFTHIQEQEGKQRISWKTVISLSLTEKSASCANRILHVIPSMGVNSAPSRALGSISSGLGILLGGTVALGDGVMDLKRSLYIRDLEGKRQAAFQISSGTISVPASAFSIVQNFSPTAFAGISTVSGVLSAIGAFLSLAIASISIYQAGSFRSELNKILRVQGVSEKDRLLHALQFLREKVAPTRKERDEIVKEIEREHPKWSSLAKQVEVEKRLFNLAEVKIRYMERRMGRMAINRLLNDLDPSILRLQSQFAPSQKDLVKATELVGSVQKSNLTKILLSIVIAIASVLAFSAIIIGTFFSLGILPLVLYALSASIALIVMVCPLVILAIKGGDRSAAIRRMVIATNQIAISP